MSAVVDANMQVRVIKVTPPTIERVTPADFGDAEKISRVINAQRDAILAAYPRIPLEYTDFEFHMTAGTRYALHHGYNGATRAWLVNWVPDSFGANPFPYLIEVWPVNATTGLISDQNTLVVLASSSSTGQATVRVAPRGV